MLGPIIIFVMFIILVVIFSLPKVGSYLIWFVLFTYPHNWWYNNNFLPLNIGVDDLFCIFLFLAVVIRRNITKGVAIRFGPAFWLITSFVGIAIVASISGYSYAPSEHIVLYIKEILKFIVYWCLFYAILHCIDNERDLRRQVASFSFAALIGSLIVILQYYFPYELLPWANPLTVQSFGILMAGRATGAFLNANAASCIMICSSIFFITAVKLQKRLAVKIFTYGFIGIFLFGIMLTQSRAGLLAFGLTFFLMALFSKHRALALLVIIAGFIVMIAASEIRLVYQERIIQSYDPHTKQFGGGAAARFEYWNRYFRSATPQIYLLGQGKLQGEQRNISSTHNAYVTLITVYGLGSVIWAFIGLVWYFFQVHALRHSSDPIFSTIAVGCFWALVAWGIYAISADAIGSQYTRYLLFYWIVILDRTRYLARQQEQEFEGLYEQELFYEATPQLT